MAVDIANSPRTIPGIVYLPADPRTGGGYAATVGTIGIFGTTYFEKLTTSDTGWGVVGESRIVTLAADPTAGAGIAATVGTVGYYAATTTYYEKSGTADTAWTRLNEGRLYTLSADPRSGAGIAANVGTVGLYSGAYYEKIHTAATDWRVSRGLLDREIALSRAAELLGTTALEYWYDGGDYTLEDGFQAITAGTGAASGNTQHTQRLDTGANAASYGGVERSGAQVTGVTTNKWYMRSRSRIRTAAGNGTVMMCAGMAYGNARIVALGICGATTATGSNANFSMFVGGNHKSGGPPSAPTSAVQSSVAIETNNYHIFEAWGIGTTTIYGAVDGETPISITSGATVGRFTATAENVADAVRYYQDYDYIFCAAERL